MILQGGKRGEVSGGWVPLSGEELSRLILV